MQLSGPRCPVTDRTLAARASASDTSSFNPIGRDSSMPVRFRPASDTGDAKPLSLLELIANHAATDITKPTPAASVVRRRR